jgi:pyruvate,water dikinase
MVNSKEFILRLNNISRKNVNKCGSKASNLGELIKKGFPIPNGFVINTYAYLLFLSKNNLIKLIQNKLGNIEYSNYEAIDKMAKEIQYSIENSDIPIEVLGEIKEEYDELLSTNTVVRSSATAEDLQNASFAGQYDTFLNLKSLSDVIQNIKKCYASIWTGRAIIYRHEKNIKQTDVKIAALVQEMVPAKCAGVLFTKNPVTMKKDEIIVESNYGLGESIVSGHCSPDQFIVKKEIHHGKNKFKIIEKQIGKKNFAVYPKTSESESGVEIIELSEQKNMQSSLSNQQIIQLSKLGVEIEKCFKTSQDIEWAIDQNDKIHILQSRPITTKASIDSEDDMWFTRGYSDDYWNDPCTPLFFDLLGDPLTKIVNMELNSIMGYKEINKKLLKLYNGHVYFNLNVLKKKVEYEIPIYLRNEDLLNYFPEGSGPYGKKTMKDLPFRTFKRLFSEIRIMMHDPDGAIKKTSVKYETWSEQIFNPYCDNFDSKLKELSISKDLYGLVDLAEELDRIMVAHYRLIRYGLPVHNIGMNLMVQYLLTRFLGKEKSSRLYPVLISGLNHKLTETNDEIHKLASIIQESPKIKSLILEYDSEEIYDYISSERDPTIQAFFKEFEKFLKAYGDRGFSREVHYPRWNEAPMYVFDILKSLVMGKEHELKKIRAKNLNYREKIERYVEAKIRSQRFGFLKWKIISIILNFSRQYIIFREAQRFNLDRWITRNRNVYLEIGKILAQKGIFKESTDIFFLHKKEINKIILEKLDHEISSLIKKRQDEFFKYEYTIPPKFLHRSREFDDIFQFTKESYSFQGIPTSQGIITGKIRILNKIEDIPMVEAGEILVVPKTDPGWTPIFSKISGLITETGGILSHGAVISREYGIAAVTNIPHACKLFKTGQIVTINGYNGSVIIKK